jgi:hypothetical protein
LPSRRISSCIFAVDGDAGAQPQEGFVELVEALVRNEGCWCEGDGRPDLFAARPVEVAAHDADNFVRLLVEEDGLADGVVAASEDLLPEAVAEDGDRSGVGLVFLRGEGAAKDGTRSKDLEPL